MRSFLAFALFAAVAVAILAIVLIPVLVAPLVATAVREASPFGETPLEVVVDVNALGLIGGSVDRIHVTASDLESDGTTIGALDLTVTRVSTSDRSFERIAGSISEVTMLTDLGDTVQLERVDLEGPSEAVTATATLSAEAAVALLSASIRDAGLDPAGLQLIDGGIRLGLLGQPVDVAVGVVDGALVLPAMFGGGEIVVFAPEPDAPWQLTGVAVTPAGMLVDARVDAGGVPARE